MVKRSCLTQIQVAKAKPMDGWKSRSQYTLLSLDGQVKEQVEEEDCVQDALLSISRTSCIKETKNKFLSRKYALIFRHSKTVRFDLLLV